MQELSDPTDAGYGWQAVFPGHHRAVGQLPPALHDQPPRQAKDGRPAWTSLNWRGVLTTFDRASLEAGMALARQRMQDIWA